MCWTSFCGFLGPNTESVQIEHPQPHFVNFWSQGQKVLKSFLLYFILASCEAKLRKCGKSNLLDVILSTSGAKTRKCSNQASRALFGGLLEARKKCSNRSSWTSLSTSGGAACFPVNAYQDSATSSGTYKPCCCSCSFRSDSGAILQMPKPRWSAQMPAPDGVQIERLGLHFVKF